MVIKLVSLKSGITLIGNVTDISTGIFSIREPLVVYSQPASDGKGNMIGFTPFLDYTEEFQIGIIFNEKDVLTMNTPVKDMINQYNKVFGSGIEIVKSLKDL